MTEHTQISSRALLDELPHLRRFAFSLARDQADADDLTQATLERALGSAPPDGAGLRPWLFRICRNVWIDDMRKSKTRTEAAPHLKVVSNDVPSAERQAEGEMMLSSVRTAIEALPDQYREVLSLVAVGGMSYREASESIGAPVGTVMSRLARGRAMLAEAVGYDG